MKLEEKQDSEHLRRKNQIKFISTEMPRQSISYTTLVTLSLTLTTLKDWPKHLLHCYAYAVS